ncbi:MAG: choice-of-anchor tandem repeat GloVer-containing protein [Bryobacteraceae bacterium]
MWRTRSGFTIASDSGVAGGGNLGLGRQVIEESGFAIRAFIYGRRDWGTLGALGAMAGQGQTFTTLASFDGRNGATPGVSLVQGINGDLYGTAVYGGASDAGTVFRITPQGQLKTVHSFAISDGEYPNRLLAVSDGTIHGTTYGGGANGCGTIFTISPGGAFTTVASFDSIEQSAGGVLAQGFNGMLYGATGGESLTNEGTVFETTPGGAITVAHSFTGSDDSYPDAGGFRALTKAGRTIRERPPARTMARCSRLLPEACPGGALESSVAFQVL